MTLYLWHNRRWHLGENKSIVPVQTFFTPILKAKSILTKIKIGLEPDKLCWLQK